MNWKRLSVILGIVVALISIGGATFQVDKRFAKAGDVQQIGWRLDHKIIKDRINALQERIWNLEDRYNSIKSVDRHTESIKRELLKEIRKLQQEKNMLIKELEKLIERIQTR